MTLLYIIGTSLGFFGNRKLTFVDQGNIFSSGIRYVITHFFGYLLNLSILITFVDKLGYSHQLVQAIAILVVAAFLFIAFKFFVFSDENISNTGEL